MLIINIMLLPVRLIFVMPGKILMAFKYYFPSGINDAVQSARQRGKLGFEIFYSIIFWLFIGYIVFALYPKPPMNHIIDNGNSVRWNAEQPSPTLPPIECNANGCNR